MTSCLLLLPLVVAVSAIEVPVKQNCAKLVPNAHLQANYYENVAHAVHSMNVHGLRMFNSRATVRNSVPTVNLNVSSPLRVRTLINLD